MWPTGRKWFLSRAREHAILLIALPAIAADPATLAKWAADAQAGRCREVAPAMESALTTSPKSGPEAWGLLGQCYQQLKQPEAAVDALKRGSAQYPANATLLKVLGETQFSLNRQSADAGKSLAEAVRLAPRDPEAHHYYAQWAFINFRERVCVTEERAALRLPGLPDLALLQMNTLLGLCQDKIEEPEAARAAFQAANRINARLPQYDPVAAYQYLQFLVRFGDDAEAQKLIDEILAKIPNFGPAYLERAKYLDRKQQPEKAIQEAEQALRSQGNDLNAERAAHQILARNHFLLGHTTEADREREWIDAHPNPETPRN
jgi:tetratricopeptide (TPR) repeat protein